MNYATASLNRLLPLLNEARDLEKGSPFKPCVLCLCGCDARECPYYAARRAF
jgi:hypothetical protein